MANEKSGFGCFGFGCFGLLVAVGLVGYGFAWWNASDLCSEHIAPRMDIETCNLSLRLNPIDGDSLRSRGYNYERLGNHEQAIEDYTNAMHLRLSKKGYALAYWERGDAYKALEKPKQAIEDYTRALDLLHDPEQRFYVYMDRAFARQAMGDIQGAERDFTQARHLNRERANELIKAYKKTHPTH
jgi:tetratricopeptide (TPR) repeat protein